jgi:orotate phosphoribosyltransferase
VIEDLISTGQSSLKAVQALKDAGVSVKGLISIFNYGFPLAAEAFKSAGCPVYSLSNYDMLIERASLHGYIADSDLEKIRSWRDNPETWGV